MSKWDGTLSQYVDWMTQACAVAKGYGLETMVLVRDSDPIGNQTSYRCIRCCDYIVAIGLLTVAMDDMMVGDDVEEVDG